MEDRWEKNSNDTQFSLLRQRLETEMSKDEANEFLEDNCPQNWVSENYNAYSTKNRHVAKTKTGKYKLNAKKKNSACSRCFNKYYLVIAIMIGLICTYCYLTKSQKTNGNLEIKKEKISNLKKKFPSQSKELWATILSILAEKNTNSKCLFLIYSDSDDLICNVLEEEIASIYKGDEHSTIKLVKMESEMKTKSQGELLEHYRQLSKKYRVFPVDLAKVPSKTVEMFHFLLDENYSEGNPPLFIFKLK